MLLQGVASFLLLATATASEEDDAADADDEPPTGRARRPPPGAAGAQQALESMRIGASDLLEQVRRLHRCFLTTPPPDGSFWLSSATR